MQSNSIHWNELEATLRRYVERSYEAAVNGADELTRIGALARDIGGRDPFLDAGADELDQRASGLRGCALHALTVSLEIAMHAGRLAELADVRRAKASATGR